MASKRIHVVAPVVVVGLLALLPAAAHARSPRTICVGPAAGCAHGLRAAIAAAADGDTIRLGARRYRGGVVIDKSVHLVGVGQRRSVIVGGGPVVTVSVRPNGSRPTVTLTDLSLTGGTAVGDGVSGFGGGLRVTPVSGQTVGATVTLTRVRVHDNRATATHTSGSPSGVKCPHGFCPFAFAAGGGIANSGRLTLIDSRVDGNALDGRLSDADGGGIFSEFGSLTVVSSVIADNHAGPQDIGRFAEGGGIFVNSGDLHVTDSQIDANSADLITNWPVLGQGVLIDMNANSGGIHIGDGSHATITRSRIADNTISADDASGEPLAFDSALLAGDSSVVITGTDIVHNQGFANSATDADVGFSGDAIEFDGPALVARSSISHNFAVSVSQAGPAGVGGGLAVYDFSNNPRQVTVADSKIVGNRSYAYSGTDAAAAFGGGVINNSLLALDGVTVADNVVRVAGMSASAQGGGIWNGALLSGPPVTLTLQHSTITRNVASVASAGTAQGGGVYTTEPVTRSATVITGNRPDNFFDGSAPRSSGQAHRSW